MRYILVLALVCGCVWAPPAVADPLTKRNNDASVRPKHLPEPRPRGPSRPIAVPTQPDFGPSR
jgi:hypothetical protein